MSTHPFTRMVASGLLATAIGGGAMTPSQSMPLPVTSVQAIAGAAPTEPVRWRGYGWGYRGYGWGYGGYRGYGWGWRRPNYGGAIAAGAIAGGILGLAAAASTPYYGYGYPAYYGYYPAYRRVYYRPAYYRPVYYRRAYYRPVYYRRAYWRPVYYRRAYYRRAYWW